MLDFGELRQSINDADTKMRKNIGHLVTMEKDAKRVGEIAKNASVYISDIDRKFEQMTKLTGIDITFLFFAVAFQLARQYLITNFKERADHQEAAKPSKKIEEKVLGKESKEESQARKNSTHSWYRPSFEEVTFNPVPFDITTGVEGLGGAFEHRAKTPGHDPILGYIFGTANIATSTLTVWEGLQSFHIKYGEVSSLLKPMKTNSASTSLVFHYAIERAINEKGKDRLIIPISLFREIMHLKSDMYSKVSLPFPVISAQSPDLAKKIADYGFDMANIATVGRQAAYSMLINSIIAMLHRLMYDHNGGGSLSLYEVRTRKILSYSNLIATASNVLAVAIASGIGAYNGNEELVKKALSYLDIGGLMVTVYRIVTDTKFIQQVKQEFLEKEFYNVVMADDFDF
jgi:hypothetical protein